MNKEQILKELERDSFNGDLTISEFRKRVEMYAEKYHEEKLKESTDNFFCDDKVNKCKTQCHWCKINGRKFQR